MTHIPKYLSIGNRIEQIRHMKGLSQAKFADSIGISRTALSAIENGLTRPSKPILYTIEWKYGFRHEWIVTGDEPLYLNDFSPPVIMPISGYETPDRVLLFWFNILTRIFEEGEKTKIEAVKAQLRALDPGMKKVESADS